jgi:hypothetical protein
VQGNFSIGEFNLTPEQFNTRACAADEPIMKSSCNTVVLTRKPAVHGFTVYKLLPI